jgi:hypothetical protein
MHSSCASSSLLGARASGSGACRGPRPDLSGAWMALLARLDALGSPLSVAGDPATFLRPCEERLARVALGWDEQHGAMTVDRAVALQERFP